MPGSTLTDVQDTSRMNGYTIGSNTHTANWANGPYSPADTGLYRACLWGPGNGIHLGPGGVGVLGTALARQLYETQPSIRPMIINAAAAGMDIDFFMPSPSNHLNLSTQYGATLYRIRAAQQHYDVKFKHMAIFQGEADAYRPAYHKQKITELVTALKNDISDLEHFYLIQINPVNGCSGYGQDSLRENMRRLDGRLINGVTIHLLPALGTYQVDQCHLEADGYVEVSRRLFKMIRHYEYGDALYVPKNSNYYFAPNIGVLGEYTEAVYEYRLDPSRYPSAIPVGENLSRYIKLKKRYSAGLVTVDSIEYNYTGDLSKVMFHTTDTARPATISYLPDFLYQSQNVVYRGPWIMGLQDQIALPSFGNVRVNDMPIVLPIVIADFRVAPNSTNPSVELSLQMEAEDDIAYFKVLRSTDAIHFDSIGVFTPKGSNGNNYTWTDVMPFNGNNYYQIEIKASVSKGTKSKIKNVLVQGQQALLRTNLKGKHYQLLLADDSAVTYIKLYDALGRELAQLPNTYLNDINAETYSTGLYIISIRYNDGHYELYKMVFD